MQGARNKFIDGSEDEPEGWNELNSVKPDSVLYSASAAIQNTTTPRSSGFLASFPSRSAGVKEGRMDAP